MTPKKFFLGLMVAIGVLLVGGGVAYVVVSQVIAEKRVSLQKQLASETVADDKLMRLAELQTQYDRITPLLTRFEQALPKSKKQSEIALQLQQLATTNGMTLPSITFAPSTTPSATSQTVKDGSLLALPISFQLTGTYEQLQGFLRSLESLNRYTVVKNLSITRGEVKSKTLSFTIGINVYVKP